jgi:hypothetical protein
MKLRECVQRLCWMLVLLRLVLVIVFLICLPRKEDEPSNSSLRPARVKIKVEWGRAGHPKWHDATEQFGKGYTRRRMDFKSLPTQRGMGESSLA